MQKSKVYHLPQDKFEDVPGLISQLAPNLFKENEFVALKIHFGEKGVKGFIRPGWTKCIVNYVKEKKAHPFFTDTNTIYRGQRADAVNHMALAQGHGFKIERVGAPVIIADGLRGNDYAEVAIDGIHYRSVKIARSIYDSHAMICMTHVKGHMLSGFGGALKNLGMGCAAKTAKFDMHSDVCPNVDVDKCIACGECIKWCAGDALELVDDKIVLDKNACVGCGECILACASGALDIPWDAAPGKVQEKFVEHALGAVKDKPVCYVNYMHSITKNCDCMPLDQDIHILDDQGILVSTDPVAIDQASLDIINKAAGKDLFKELHGTDPTIQLAYAEKLGLGSREYIL